MNERSILSVVTRICESRSSEEWPVPKSSIATRRPRSCRSAMMGSRLRGRAIAADSVISIIRRSAGMPEARIAASTRWISAGRHMSAGMLTDA
jgi:hypothetical protein